MKRAGLSPVRALIVISPESFMGFLAVLVMAALTASPLLAAPCESLASLKLPNTTFISANTVAAGAFTPPTLVGSAIAASQFSTLPAFCRVAATLTPSSDSDIKIEVWLPVSGWNGKFQAVGNGGFAGVISYPALASAVKAGYASASTDTGHQGNTAAFAMGHPEKVIDFADRAVHEMTVQAKSIVNAYYGGAPKLSFWNGCSQGGRQGITEAAKYPADFDGIVAGASGIYWMRLLVARMAINVFAHRGEDSYIPPDKYALIHEAVLKACDALDGVKDGVIENPTVCHFDPKVLVCKGADGPNCLAPAQAETARALYSPVKNSKTGAEIVPALLQPGSELAGQFWQARNRSDMPPRRSNTSYSRMRTGIGTTSMPPPILTWRLRPTTACSNSLTPISNPSSIAAANC